ncbi:MAG: efflux RND transporter periplasmic adaptor subunit, partial [Polymorphobacter sp.]
MQRRTWIILAVVILAVAGYFGWRAFTAPAAGAAFKTAALERGDLDEVITANGTLNPVRVVSVGTQVSGTVARLYVDYNDRVRAGQLLLELDPSVYAARLAASEANLASIKSSQALAAANAARAGELYRQNFISRQEYETTTASAVSARAQVAQALAQIRQDRTNLGYTVIRSPVAGVVISREVDLGQTVAASFNTPTLFKIARDLTKMQIEAAVAEADVSRVAVGQRVDFTVDAYGTRAFAGTVSQVRLNPTTLQNVVTYTVIVAVANPDGALLPGMTANAAFLVSAHRDVLLIPNAALSFKPDGWKPVRGGGKAGAAADKAGGRAAHDANALTVFVLKDGEPSPVRIRIGASDSDFSEVVAGGLKAGTEVIIADSSKDKKPAG